MSIDKVIQFSYDDKIVQSVGDRKIKKGDLVGGINAYFSSLKNNFDYMTLAKIAGIYSEMGLIEQSNFYWFKYLAVSPKSEHSIAYEELAMNYFELNNLLASSIYLHKRLDASPTPLSSNIDEDLINMLGDAFSYKKQFRVVYPNCSADFTKEVNDGISAVKCCNYKKAIALLKDIPETSNDYLKAGEYLAIAYYLSGDVTGALNLNDELLYKNPNSVSVLCNQSSILFSEKRIKESKECYRRALSIPAILPEEKFKVATCSLEHGEVKTALFHFKDVIKDDLFDINVLLLYSQALINDELFDRAEEVLSRCYKIDPENLIVKFYLRFVADIKAGDISLKSLPVPYGNIITVKETLDRIKYIESIYKGNNAKLQNALKNDKTYEILTWGAVYSDYDVAKNCVGILSHSTSKRAKSILSNLLLSDKVSPEIKQTVLYGNLINGNFSKFSIVLNEYFITVKPVKPKFMNSERHGDVFIGYAIAFAKLTVCGLKNFNKLADAMDELCFAFRDGVKEFGLSYEELAMVITMLADYSEIKKEDYSKIFEVKKGRLKQIRLMLQEIGNDKDN